MTGGRRTGDELGEGSCEKEPPWAWEAEMRRRAQLQPAGAEWGLEGEGAGGDVSEAGGRDRGGPCGQRRGVWTFLSEQEATAAGE